MELVEILLFLFFIVLPLLQHFLGGRKEPPPGPAPRNPEEFPAPEPAARPEPTLARTGGGPPAGERPVAWGDWPATTAERVADGDVVDEEDALEFEEWRENLDPEVVPEAVRVSAPVYSLESLNVDRDREHDRFHQRVRPPRIQTAAAALRRPRVASLLGDRDDLRRAVLMAEVLGPPRGLR